MYYIEKYMNYQLELIDTLWNVNVKKVDTDEWEYQELIDTLWNVNTHLKLI